MEAANYKENLDLNGQSLCQKAAALNDESDDPSTGCENTPQNKQDLTWIPEGINLLGDAEEYFAGENKRFWKTVGIIFCTLIAGSYALFFIVLGSIIAYTLCYGFDYFVFTLFAFYLSFSQLPQTCGIARHNSYLYCSIALYFSARIYGLEPKHVYTKNKKPILFLFHPHGTLPLGTMCTVIATWRTAVVGVADVVLKVPFVRQLFAPYNQVSCNRNSLIKNMRDRRVDCILHPGGLAEMFLSDREKERSYFRYRKSCVRVALESGADICNVYVYGHTQLYRIVSLTSRKFSRRLKVAVAWILGRKCTPVPYNTKIDVVYGKVIKMPDYSWKSVDNETVARQHEIVMTDLEKLYYKARVLNANYRNKDLVFI